MTKYGRKLGKTIAGLIIVAVFCWAFVIQYEVLKHRSPLAVGQVELLEDGDDSDFSPDLVDRAKVRLAQFPNDQRALNLLSVGLAKTGIDQAEKDKIFELLAKLGWRYSVVQQNRIINALKTGDLETIVISSDALLRRNLTENRIIDLLYLVEIEQGTQQYLVKQLSFNPGWRNVFFRRPNALRSEAQIEARARTLNMMLDSGDQISRSNMAPSLFAMANSGKLDMAMDIFQKYVGTTSEEIINDPTFQELARAQNTADYRSLPFEWIKHDTRGLQISAIEGESETAVRIKWDGRGTPLMFSQFVKIAADQQYHLQVTGSDATPDLTRRLQFSLSCQAGAARFDQLDENSEAKKLVLSSADALPCEFAKLEIKGRIQDVARPQDIGLSSIQMIAFD